MGKCPKCGAPFIEFDPEVTDVVHTVIYFNPNELSLEYKEQLAQDAYDAVLQQLEEKYPDSFEDMHDN